MDNYEKTLNELFEKGQENHMHLVDEWIKGRDDAIAALNWLAMTASRFEANWRGWKNVVGKRKALRASRKLKKQVSKTQAAIYDFLSNAV